jgi:DNA-directed RNA polymerase specialized sigma24 family protein
MSTRDDQISSLYNDQAARLVTVVGRIVRNVPQATIEDACSFAWMQLVRHDNVDPTDPSTFSWLTKVAFREAIYQARLSSERAPLAVTDDPIDAAALTDVFGEVEARETLALLDQLHPMQRQAIFAKSILGLSYDEAYEALGVTRTWLNRHLTEGRKALRKLRGE